MFEFAVFVVALLLFLLRSGVHFRRFVDGRRTKIHELAEIDVGTDRYPQQCVTLGAYTRPLSALTPSLMAPSAFRPVVRRMYPIAGELLVVSGFVFLWHWGVLSLLGMGIAISLYATSPIGISQRHSPSVQYTTHRLGLGFYSVSTIFVWLGTTSNDPVWVVLAVVSGIATLLTHRLYATLFVGTTLAMASLSLLPAALVVVASVLSAVILSEGRALRHWTAVLKTGFDALFRDYSHLNSSSGLQGNPKKSTMTTTLLFLCTAAVLPVLSPPPTGGVNDIGFALVWFGMLSISGLLAAAVSRISVEIYTEIAYATVVPASIIIGSSVRPAPEIATLAAAVSIAGFVLAVTADDVDRFTSQLVPDSFLDEVDSAVVVVQPSYRSPEIAGIPGVQVVDFFLNSDASTDQLRLFFPEQYLVFSDDAHRLQYYFNPDWLVVDREALELIDYSDDSDVLLPRDVLPEFQNNSVAIYDFDDLAQPTERS